jgi:hypothetical protein
MVEVDEAPNTENSMCLIQLFRKVCTYSFSIGPLLDEVTVVKIMIEVPPTVEQSPNAGHEAIKTEVDVPVIEEVVNSEDVAVSKLVVRNSCFVLYEAHAVRRM